MPEQIFIRPEVNRMVVGRALSVTDAIRYLGGMSRSKFYTDVLQHLDARKLHGRTVILVESLDAFLDRAPRLILKNNDQRWPKSGDTK